MNDNQPAAPRRWCIYVERDSLGNFDIGRKRGVWGAKTERKFRDVRQGDELLFVHNIRPLVQGGRSGFPRVGAEQFRELAGPADIMVLARATSDPYEDDSPVWSNANYPFRFDFEEVAERRQVPFTGEEVEIVESIRRAMVTLQAVPVPSIPFFEVAPQAPDPVPDLTRLVPEAAAAMAAAGLTYPPELLARFAASLLAKPLLILTGLSGSGKTRLALSFAQWISSGSQTRAPAPATHALVPVGADWTSNDRIVGYPDALNERRYVSTPVLALLLAAAANQDQPYFLILDEMNLSPVERYFADFLSAMESGQPIGLYDCASPADPGSWREGVPPSVSIPSNLFIIGTVNVDETTYMFSPKVLDRANVIEFRVGDEEMMGFLAARAGTPPAPIPAARMPAAPMPGTYGAAAPPAGGAAYGTAFLRARRGDASLRDESASGAAAEIAMLFRVLASSQQEFGFRTAQEMLRFVRYHQELIAEGWTLQRAMDAQVYQKILPRMQGSRRRLEPVLCALAVVCHRNPRWGVGDDGLLQVADRAGALDERYHPLVSPTEFPANEAYYPLSFGKILRMLQRLDQDGFASFAEA